MLSFFIYEINLRLIAVCIDYHDREFKLNLILSTYLNLTYFIYKKIGIGIEILWRV